MFESLPDLPVARRWRQQRYPVASVLALIRHDDVSSPNGRAAHYLLIQRQTAPYVGKWGLVGGRWEFGESLAEAITREVKEETGLDTTFVALRGLVNERIAPLGPHDEGAHFLLFICGLSAGSGQAREQSEGPVAWFNAEELAKLRTEEKVIASDYAILQRFGASESALTFIEAQVLSGEQGTSSDALVHFEPGP